MYSRKLKRLNLDPDLVNKLEKLNYTTCKDVLCLTRIEFLHVLGVSDKNREKLLEEASKACAPSPRTAYEIFESKKESPTNGFFPTSLPTLDRVLQGGIPLKSITEITGPPSVGKTQFCLLLTVLATLPTSMGGLNGNVIYVDTESAFSAERLKEIAETRIPEVYASETEILRLMQSVHVHRATTSKALKEIIQKIEWDVIRKGIKLIVIDSMASLLRKEFSSDGIVSLVERNRILIEQAAILKRLVETFEIAVFVTNQITTHVAEKNMVVGVETEVEDSESESSCDPSPPAVTTQEAEKVEEKEDDNAKVGNQIIPALGITWAHCVSTRLVAEFLDSKHRQLMVVKSPLAPNVEFRYTIEKRGIVLSDDEVRESTYGDPTLQNIRTKSNFLRDVFDPAKYSL